MIWLAVTLCSFCLANSSTLTQRFHFKYVSANYFQVLKTIDGAKTSTVCDTKCLKYFNSTICGAFVHDPVNEKCSFGHLDPAVISPNSGDEYLLYVNNGNNQ